jgi:hypothetical protein
MEAAYTVRQLREELEGADPDARVFFTCSYGDYHHTPQALPVGEIVEDLDTNDLAETAYSQSGIRLVEDREPEDEPRPEADDEDVFPVVILRS